MNRIDRVAAILIQLQSKKITRAQEIATRFSISLRTVYRDIKTLEEAGVPISGEAGVGYSIMEGYRLPPVMFTKEEALAFCTAEKLVAQFTDQISARQFESAMYKLKSVLRYAEKDLLDAVSHQVAVVKSPHLTGTASATLHLQNLLSNIAEKTIIQINYSAGLHQLPTTREIEPVGIYYLGNYWYLVAYCNMRNDYRTFRTDRIKNLVSTDKRFNQQHPSLQTFLNKIRKEKELFTVVIRVDKAVLSHFGDQKYYHGFLSEIDLGAQVEMTFVTCSLAGFAKYYLLFGEHADVVCPAELKIIISNQMQLISNRLKKNTALIPVC